MGKKPKKSAGAGKIRSVTSKIPLVKKIELWPIEKLRPYAKNSRTHSSEQIAEIAASYKAYGMNQPILWNDHLGIVAGEGRYLAAKMAELSHVPVIRLGHLTAAKAKAYLIADNKLAEHAGWNTAILAEEIKALEELGEDVSNLGFSEDELSVLLPETDLTEHFQLRDERMKGIPQNVGLPPGPIIETTTSTTTTTTTTPQSYEPLKFESDGLNRNFQIQNADCLEYLKTLSVDSVDSLVTDPPAGISFMGKEWDDDRGGRKQWIAWLTDVMKESLRVLKPGAHGLVWALPRTSHWTGNAVEDAGFEIRDVVTHLFGSGFPKSLDISKAIDRAAGAEREVTGTWKPTGTAKPNKGEKGHSAAKTSAAIEGYEREEDVLLPRYDKPATAAAAAWDGWGTALKPASEHWFLIRKPLSEKTVAANVIKHGTGGLNIDDCRIGTEERFNPPTHKGTTAAMGDFSNCNGEGSIVRGRFPANLVLSHTEKCIEISQGKRAEGKRAEGKRAEGKRVTIDMGQQVRERDNSVTYKDDVPPTWECDEGCPIKILDEQSGDGDTGGASRFFYCAKPAASEKHGGLDNDPVKVNDGRETEIDNPFQRGETLRHNTHPTVKPVKLMQYFCKMVTPPGGLVLDVFAGSGTTGIAALSEGFNFIGIEKDFESSEIARNRIRSAFPKATDITKK